MANNKALPKSSNDRAPRDTHNRPLTAISAVLNLAEAAAYCKCSRDHMRDLAAADQVPATKIGKRWVFSAELLDEWIKQRCRSKAAPAPRTGGFESRSLASKLAAQRKQLTETRQKNSSAVRSHIELAEKTAAEVSHG